MRALPLASIALLAAVFPAGAQDGGSIVLLANGPDADALTLSIRNPFSMSRLDFAFSGGGFLAVSFPVADGTHLWIRGDLDAQTYSSEPGGRPDAGAVYVVRFE